VPQALFMAEAEVDVGADADAAAVAGAGQAAQDVAMQRRMGYAELRRVIRHPEIAAGWKNHVVHAGLRK
jgi:hypothetical protein